MRWLAPSFATVLAVAACDADQAPSGATSTARPLESVAMTDAALDKADLPVPEDFEDQAAQQISEENMDDELVKLEAELGAPR